ncbi:MAG: TolC family protein [Chitinophagaceae bacterium]|nr:TolC family protein [Chitinophagaceae bacterium]
MCLCAGHCQYAAAKFNDFKIKAATKTSAAARGNLYPTLSAFGSLSGSNSSTNDITGYQNLLPHRIQNRLKGTILIMMFTPCRRTGAKIGYSRTDAFGNQFNRNFRQSLGLSLSVPIFNGYNTKAAYERSRINIRSLQLQKDLDNQTLKQNIYQAYNAAMVALQKYNAGRKSLETTERTYGFALKRYEVGLMSTFELITNQNNVFRAKLENALNQFDYVFKMKVLEFYKGQGLKL